MRLGLLDANLVMNAAAVDAPRSFAGAIRSSRRVPR
jgi:hypothetical protein